MKQTKAENQTSSAMSKPDIRRTTRSMTAALLSRRNLSVGDVLVIELSDSLDVRPNPSPIGPSMLDIKYVSISVDKVVDSQQVNLEGSQEIDRKPHLTEEAQVNLKESQKTKLIQILMIN